MKYTLVYRVIPFITSEPFATLVASALAFLFL